MAHGCSRTPAAGKFDLDIDVAQKTGRARVTTADADRIDLPETAGFVHAGIGRKMGGH